MDFKNWILPKRNKCKPALLRLSKNWILKQKWQKSLAGTRQTEGKTWFGLEK
jgi:hypothetical protein